MSNYQSNTFGGLAGFGDLQGNQQTFTLPNTTYTYPATPYNDFQYVPLNQTYQYSTFIDKTEQALNVLKKLKTLGKIDFDNVDDFIETLEEVKNAI